MRLRLSAGLPKIGGHSVGVAPIAGPVYSLALKSKADPTKARRLGFNEKGCIRVSNAHIRHEVQKMLDQVKEQIMDAEMALAAENDCERVNAAGQLALLSRQRDMVEERLREIDKNQRASEDIVDLVREELFNPSLRLRQIFAQV